MRWTDLTLAFVSTIRHDGSGGVADDLGTTADLDAWLRQNRHLFSGHVDIAELTVGDEALQKITALRAAVRALFAQAVWPGPSSRADAGRLPHFSTAIQQLNDAAKPVGPPLLAWPEGQHPYVDHQASDADPWTALRATLAWAAIAFLSSDDRARLRSCQAPRCVRYFLQDDPRQQWCKPSCGNRARVARHHQRHQVAAMATQP